ncbi:MAG: uracil-DNA glycosylase family protein [Lautropia sp.]|nr:uracil-DNA glycosylase family protein [Lautropia sp.]
MSPNIVSSTPFGASPTACVETTDVTALALLNAAQSLKECLAGLQFAPPVVHLYDPLDYAWSGHAAYLSRYGPGRKRIMFLGMNPGPFGMMQTGVPFGEVAAVRDWMGIETPIAQPENQHPKRLIEGFACRRSEVSGRRLWGWIARRWGSAENFFRQAMVINYCPLVFLEASGKNRTPAQLPAAERRAIEHCCDRHLAQVIEALQPEWVIGIGGFAERRLKQVVSEVLDDRPLARRIRIGVLLHPSPASPAANRGWDEVADRQMRDYGLLPAES